MSKLLDVKYYIKKDNEVSKINQEEYEEFKRKLKEENKNYICPNCNVCDCEKIRYTDINICEEVDLGLFIRKIYQISSDEFDKKNVDDTFKVYECKKFHPFREIVINEELQLKDEIITLDKQINELKEKNKDEQELKELQKLRLQKRRKIHDELVLEKLKLEEKLLKKKLYSEKQKKLKLENNDK